MTTVTRLDYCQFLLVSQTNYTLTYFADPQVRSSSPLYTRLTLGIADLPDVLALCVECLEDHLIKEVYS